MNPKGPHPIDIMVGAKVRHFRTLRGMSQETLGESIGITFQQIQKYEKGTNRISASRLVQIAQVLSVDVRLFFDGVEAVTAEDAPPIEQISKAGHEVGGLIDKIPNQKVKTSILSLLRAIVRQSGEVNEEAA